MSQSQELPGLDSIVINALSEARRVFVLSGSGISAESGIPTFRGADGMWEGLRAEDLATPEGFQRDPDRVWAWYRWRAGRVRAAAPNPAHVALNTLERHRTVTIATQNVDELHQRAGSRPLELHGSILRQRCEHSGCRRGDGPLDTTEGPAPRCACGARCRPAVVWFGESLPETEMSAAARAAERCEVAIVVGTSSQVYPAAGLAQVALAAGAHVIEINPEETPLTGFAQSFIRAPAGRVLPALVTGVLDQTRKKGHQDTNDGGAS